MHFVAPTLSAVSHMVAGGSYYVAAIDNPISGLVPDFNVFGAEFTTWWQKLFAGLWAAGVDVNDLFTDDGRLDRDRLSASVTDAVDRLGLTWAPRTPKPDPSQGMSSGSNYGHATWGALLERQ